MKKDELERLIEESGVGSRTANKLRRAYDRQHGSSTPASSQRASRPSGGSGHGAPAQDQTPLRQF